MNSGGLHHVHLRKRGKAGLEPYPAQSSFKRSLDKLMFVVAFVAPIALLPQVHQVYFARSVAGLSLYTWGGLTVVNGLWALYGLVHKDRPIFIANLLIALLNLSVAIGIVKYAV